MEESTEHINNMLQYNSKDTFYAKGDISYKEMKEFTKEPSNLIEIIAFDNSVLQDLHENLPILCIKERLGTGFNNITKLGISKILSDKIKTILDMYPVLHSFQVQIALIICFGIPDKNIIRFHNVGKLIPIFKELSRLKNLLEERAEVDADIIDPETSTPITIKEPYLKYRINQITVELIDENAQKKTVKLNVYDDKVENNDSNYSIYKKVNLDILFGEIFTTIIEKLKISDKYEKVNTNHLFCQQFFQYINNKTPFSTSANKSEREILTLFTYVYKLTKHSFPKTEDEIELVEKWLKPTRK